MTQKTAAPATCTVNATAFVVALRDLIRTSGDDTSLPVICGVLLHTDTYNGKTVLVGTSTDRFRLGQSHLECTGAIPQAFISLADAKRLLATLKLYIKVDASALLEIVLDGNRLIARLGALTVPISTDVALDEDVPETRFPKLAPIFSSTAVTPERTSGFNPKYLAVFGSIADMRGERVHLTMQGEMRPMLITIGQHYRGLLMPTREKAEPLPWFVPTKEQDALTKAVQLKAEAEKRTAEAQRKEQRNAARRAARAAAKTEQPAKTAVAKKPAAKPAPRRKAAA